VLSMKKQNKKQKDVTNSIGLTYKNLHDAYNKLKNEQVEDVMATVAPSEYASSIAYDSSMDWELPKEQSRIDSAVDNIIAGLDLE